MTLTPGQLVYVAEYGSGARPAKVDDVYDCPNESSGRRIGVTFLDTRGGYGLRFETSVFTNEQDAAKAAE